MKGLFLFIKNKRIIYKVSIVSVLILMLISVMQINPKNIKENKSTGATIDADYTICFDASTKKFYKSTDLVNEVAASTFGIELSDDSGVPVLKFNNVDFYTTASVALSIENGDVIIELPDGTENKISSSYSAKEAEYYGIVVRQGSLTFRGTGSLKVSSYNWDKEDNAEIGDKMNGAIVAYKSEDNTKGGDINISDATIKAESNGRNGRAIYAANEVNITSGNIKAYGGSSGVSEGIVGVKNVNIAGGNIDVKAKSADKYGAAIHGCQIGISNADIDIKINGKCIWGIWSSAAEGYVSKIDIDGTCNINISGNIYGKISDVVTPSAIFAQEGNIVMENGQVNIDVENTIDSNIIYGMRAEQDITVNGGYTYSKVNSENEGIAIYAGDKLNVNGGYIVAKKYGGTTGYALHCTNMVKGTDTDYSVEVMAAATDAEGKTLSDYEASALSTYKYMEIGRVYNYSLKFDTSVADISQAMKKVDAYGTETVITNSELPGWRAVEEDGKKILVLEGLDFVTAKVIECGTMKEYEEKINEAGALMITGDATVRLADNTYNRIGVVRNDFESENYCYGIMSAGVLTVEGYGELDIKCKEYCFFGIHGKDNIIFKGGVINENLDCKGATGIRNEKNLTINEGTILNINANSMNQAFGIMSEKLVKITGGEVNIILNDKQGESGELYSIGILSNDVIDVAGGNIYIKSMGQGDVEFYNGIYCVNSYNQTAGMVHIDSKNTTGIYAYNGDINIEDGTLDITAKKAMNKVPKVTASNVSISEYKSTTDIEMQYTGGTTDDVPSYSHVIIEPHYFLRYSRGKLYKCTDTNDALTEDKEYTNDAIKIDSETNTITLDNFEFTTSHRRGLYTTEDITINLVEGSKNSISTKFNLASVTGPLSDEEVSDSDGHYEYKNIVLYANSIELDGQNGDLSLSTNMTGDKDINNCCYCLGIWTLYDLKINGGNVTINCNGSKDMNSYIGAINANQSLYVSNSCIDIIMQDGVINLGIGTMNDLNVTDSDINIIGESEISNCEIYTIICYNNLNIYGSYIDCIMKNGKINNGITTINGKIIKSDVKIVGKSDTTDCKMSGIYGGGNLEIKGGSTFVDIQGANLIDGAGIDVKDNLTLNGVNATINAPYAILLEGTSSNVNILGENTITSTYSGTDTDYYGIYSKGNVTLKGTGKLDIDYDSSVGQTSPYTAIKSDGSIIIEEADIIASGNKYGIYSSDTITITSGTIKAYAYCKETTASESLGIKGINAVTINGGTITVETENANKWSGGISTDNSIGGVITITDGTIDIKTTSSNSSSVAIDSGKLNISGGDIDITTNGYQCKGLSSYNSNVGNGIYISNNADISIIGTVTDVSAGINLKNNNILDISGGTVYINYTSNSSMYDKGVAGISFSRSSNMKMSGGDVHILINQIDNNTRCFRYGVVAESGSNIEITGGKLIAEVDGCAAIITKEGNMTVTGGIIKAINKTENIDKSDFYKELRVKGTLSISGGHIVAKCYDVALKVNTWDIASSEDNDYGVRFLSVSNNYDGQEQAEYTQNDFVNGKNFKYVEIGEGANFYIKCSGNTLYKVQEGSDDTVLTGYDDKIAAKKENGKTIITLTDFQFRSLAQYGLYIADSDAEIYLNGKNHILCSSDVSDGAAIYAAGNLDIYDDTSTEAIGELEVIGKNDSTEGICASRELSIHSGKINAKVMGDNLASICGEYGVNISGGDIKVYASGETTYAIQSKNNDINITGGKVTATVTGENCTGIDGKNINIKNGEVNISSKVKGIHASNVINIADCTLTVTSEANNGINVIDSDVAESDSGTPITIDNATVTITGGASDKVLSKSDSKAPIFSKTKIVEIKIKNKKSKKETKYIDLVGKICYNINKVAENIGYTIV